MIYEEVIQLLADLKALIEPDYDFEYQIALDEAINACNKIYDLTNLLLK